MWVAWGEAPDLGSGVDERVSQLIDLALVEDIGPGDVTSEFFVPGDRMARAFLVAKENGVVAGVEVGAEVFRRVDEDIQVNVMLQDGASIAPGAYVLEASGKARSLLTAERTVINFVQRLSGVATKTAAFVEAVRGTGATIIDTRKTTPGWRFLEKAAVVDGKLAMEALGVAYCFEEWALEDGTICAAGGQRREPELTPEQVAAAVEAQGVEVRRLKEEEGLGNKDPAVMVAVAELLRLKALLPPEESA